MSYVMITINYIATVIFLIVCILSITNLFSIKKMVNDGIDRPLFPKSLILGLLILGWILLIIYWIV